MWSYSGMRPRFQWMICDSSATHGTDSSRRFHTSATPPPSRRTRSISASAVSLSNQWNAWATMTASTEASGSGIASAVPSSDLDAGNGRLERGPHARDRLDRHDLDAERQRGAGELAGARREVEHTLAGAELQHLDQMRDRGVGVRGTAPLVGLGPGAEPDAAVGFDAHARISVSSQISVSS